jgi:hypothetical protein
MKSHECDSGVLWFFAVYFRGPQQFDITILTLQNKCTFAEHTKNDYKRIVKRYQFHHYAITGKYIRKYS